MITVWTNSRWRSNRSGDIARVVKKIAFLYIAIACTAICHGLNYNSVYNNVVTPELKDAISKNLPKETKFFDEFDCKYKIVIIKSPESLSA